MSPFNPIAAIKGPAIISLDSAIAICNNFKISGIRVNFALIDLSNIAQAAVCEIGL